MRGLVDCWTIGCPASCCTVLCACPLDVGIICVFYALFSLLNVEEVYNEHPLCLIVILLASNLPSERVSLWGGPARSSPLYHYGFGADAASLRLQRCYLQLRRGHAVPRCPRCLRAQRANSDSQFFGPVCKLLRAIACTAAWRAH